MIWKTITFDFYLMSHIKINSVQTVELYVKAKILELILKAFQSMVVLLGVLKAFLIFLPMVESIKKMIDKCKDKTFNFYISKRIITKVKSK